MNKKVFMLAALLLSGNALAQTQSDSSPKPNSEEAAPESSVQISIPHSERTKGNILDAALDFLFIRFFNQFEGIKISYDFFEIDAQRDLIFKNFKVNVSRADVKGDVSFSKVLFDFSEFLKMIKSSKMEISKIVLAGPKANLTLIRKKTASSGKQSDIQRQLKISAEELIVHKFLLAIWDKDPEKEGYVLFGRAETKNAKVSLSNPSEKYFTKAASIKDITVSDGLKKIGIASAEEDGKKYDNLQAFLKAVRQ